MANAIKMMLGVFVISAVVTVYGLFRLYKVARLVNFDSVEYETAECVVSKCSENQAFVFVDMYYPNIKFSYDVERIVYEGDSLSCVRRIKSSDKYKVDQFIERFTNDGIVYFNPAHPAESIVAKPTIKEVLNESGIAVAGIGILVVGVVLLNL